jgi:hypothetical protein
VHGLMPLTGTELPCRAAVRLPRYGIQLELWRAEREWGGHYVQLSRCCIPTRYRKAKCWKCNGSNEYSLAHCCRALVLVLVLVFSLIKGY